MDEQTLIQDLLDTMHHAEWELTDNMDKLQSRLNNIRDTMRFIVRERTGDDPLAEPRN